MKTKEIKENSADLQMAGTRPGQGNGLTIAGRPEYFSCFFCKVNLVCANFSEKAGLQGEKDALAVKEHFLIDGIPYAGNVSGGFFQTLKES